MAGWTFRGKNVALRPENNLRWQGIGDTTQTQRGPTYWGLDPDRDSKGESSRFPIESSDPFARPVKIENYRALHWA